MSDWLYTTAALYRITRLKTMNRFMFLQQRIVREELSGISTGNGVSLCFPEVSGIMKCSPAQNLKFRAMEIGCEYFHARVILLEMKALRPALAWL
ncbi:hypothetical protein J6590_026845 [Homalodisca vitripennis]|nr:hypothetical protein J6590_026845 [Homalodisca vitripennis]